MKNWLKRIALAAAWKVDSWCHKIIEKLDPMSDEELRKVAHELDKKS